MTSKDPGEMATIESLSDELLIMIATKLENTMTIAKDITHRRDPDAVNDLQNLRLVSKRFAAIGAKTLFTHLNIPFSQSSAGDAVDLKTEGNLFRMPTWEDLRIFKGLEHVPLLAESHLASRVRTITIRMCYDGENEMCEEETVSEKLLGANFHRFENAQTVRIIIANEDFEETDELQRYIDDCECWIWGIPNLLYRAKRWEKTLIDYPEWAHIWFSNHLSLRRVELNFKQCYELVGPFQPCLSHGSFNKLEVISITWEPLLELQYNKHGALEVNFTHLVCPFLKALALRRVRIDSTVRGFIERCKDTLEAVHIAPEHEPVSFGAVDWTSIFKSLTRCPSLTRLSLGEGYILFPERPMPPPQMSSLRYLELVAVRTTASSLVRLIEANQTSLEYITLVAVDLVSYDFMFDTQETTQHMILASRQPKGDWVSVFNAILGCHNLNRVYFWSLQAFCIPKGGEFPFWKPFNKAAVGNGLAQTLSNPALAVQILHSRGKDMRKNFAAYLKRGELFRLLCSRGRVRCWPRISSCQQWLASLPSLADFQRGKAKIDDIFPWDPITGGTRVAKLD